MAKVLIGIPCYSTVSAETLEDYIRFAYYCGRRIQDHDFFLAIKSKTEQFRARNAIVQAALQLDCKYILMIDDDHVIDWEQVNYAHPRYGFLQKFINFLEENDEAGIIGALYFQRGGDCRPVAMYQGEDGGFYWIREDQLKNAIQEVAVTGGGCFLIKSAIFQKIDSPWFRPELDLGTDIQVCKAAREHGYKVYLDSSVSIGHVMSRREVVTPRNKHLIAVANQNHDQAVQGIEIDWLVKSALNLYREDVEEYLKAPMEDHDKLLAKYETNRLTNFYKYSDPKEYYANLKEEQLARQLWYHLREHVKQEWHIWNTIIRTNQPGYGLDYGCGSAPVTFDFVMRGHRMDFIDIDGAGGYEFLKWRVKKRNVADRCGFKLAGPYDYVMFLDSLEHFQNWKEILTEVISRLKEGGAIITNYFTNQDYSNIEHINMNHNAVKKYLIDSGIFPVNTYVWTKTKMAPAALGPA